MASLSDYLQRYGVLIRVFSVVVVSASVYALSGSALSAGPFALLLLVASPSYCLIALLATIGCVVSVYTLPSVAGIGSDGALLLVESPFLAAFLLVLAAIWAVRQRLVSLSHTAPSRPAQWAFNHSKRFRTALGAVSVILVLSLFFESTEPFQLALWAIVLLLVRREFPAPPPTCRDSKSRLKNGLLLLASVIVSAVLLESTLRWIFRDTEVVFWTQFKSMYVSDERCLYTTRPNTSMSYLVNVGPEETIVASYSTSSQGLVDRELGSKQPGEFRIVMTGDSFTAGHGVSADASTPRVLEQLLHEALPGRPISVVNAAISGYAPWQEHGFLEAKGFPLDPDLVMVQVFPGNDVDSTLIQTGEFLRSYFVPWRARVLEWEHVRRWQVGLAQWLRRHCCTLTLLGGIADPAVDFVRFWNSLRFVSDCGIPALPPSANRSDVLEVDLEEYYPELEKGMAMMLDDIDAIVQDCQARGIDTIVYSIPPAEAAVDRFLLQHTKAAGPDVKYERFKSCRLIREAMAQTHTPYVDIPAAIHDFDDTESLYLVYDGHLNEDGYRFVAERLADYLLTEYLPDHWPSATAPAPAPAPNE